MQSELDHLRLIFEDRPLEELRQILKRHNNNVQDAVEAILSQEEEPAAIGSTHNNDDRQTDGCNTDRRTSLSVVQPTMVNLPPAASTAEERRRKLYTAQKIAREKEEKELQEALRNSMAPSNRGLDHISDEALEKLMNDPVFLASLEGEDLRAAVAMQAKLDVAEEEWRALERTKPSASSSSRPNLISAVSDLSSSALHGLAERKRLKALGASFLRARSSLGIATGQEEQLVEQLEAMNRENEQEQQRRTIRLQAKTAMLDAVKEHLQSFLAENGNNATYEQWIEELHPENAYEGKLLEGLDKTIDHRFYVQESEHLQLWNEMCQLDPNNNRSPVAPRSAKVGVVGRSTSPIDLFCIDVPPPLSSEMTNNNGLDDEATNEANDEPFDPFGLLGTS